MLYNCLPVSLFTAVPPFQMGAEQSQERKNSTEVADFDFRGCGRLEEEVEEEARDCFSWQQQQNRRQFRGHQGPYTMSMFMNVAGQWGGLKRQERWR